MRSATRGRRWACWDNGVLVTIVRAGGLAGVVRQTELDSAALPPDAAARLRELIDALSWDRPLSAAGPDVLRYELTVVDGDTTSQLSTRSSSSPVPSKSTS